MSMWGFIIAIISGMLMSIQGIFNTGVTKQTSIWVSSSFVQFSALLVCLVAWVVTGRQGNFGSLFHIDNKYMLLGGAMGAFITFTVIKSVATLGPAKSAMIIVVAQLVMSYVTELFGLFEVEKVPFQWRKLVGIGLFIAGIITFKWE